MKRKNWFVAWTSNAMNGLINSKVTAFWIMLNVKRMKKIKFVKTIIIVAIVSVVVVAVVAAIVTEAVIKKKKKTHAS